ncbi:MAG TPA: alpha/beta fold hydrolase [Steroidobacteraceae bacterium]
MTRCAPKYLLLAVLLGASPNLLLAQSAELLRTYQKYEAAKSGGEIDEALKQGTAAAQLTEQAGQEQDLEGLYRDLGDFAAAHDRKAAALGFYQHALALKQKRLGSTHPDLVPLIGDIAQLKRGDRQFKDAAALYERVVAIDTAAYGADHETVVTALKALREVYVADSDTANVARVDEQLKPHLNNRGGLPMPGDVAKSRRYKQNNGFATVRVFYGTNRAPSGDPRPAQFYGTARGDLAYGYLDVTIPETHQEAELETQPRWIEYTFGVDPAEMRRRYVLLDKVTPLSKDEFSKSLHAQVSSSPSQDLFIFVHGFNNSFEDAARRVAQLTYDLDFDGTPLLYSWPSQGSATAYTIDEASVGISGRKMADFLDTVVSQSGARRIHLIAHSMGNRALIEALQTYLARRAPDKRQHLFGQIVFTAPDVDRDYFLDAVNDLSGVAERTTLYASDNDYALRSSQFVHGAPRAGTAGDVIVKLAGLDSIDMSQVPADSLGHSYFAANSGAIFDLFRLLWRGDAPAQRCGMSSSKSSDSLSVWLFNANNCNGLDILEAGVLLKRFGDLAGAKVVHQIATLTDPNQVQEWKNIQKRLQSLLPTVAPAAAPQTP